MTKYLYAWQERVVVECNELAVKITALDKFLKEQDLAQQLPQEDIDLMREQLHTMVKYSVILHERISRFKTGE